MIGYGVALPRNSAKTVQPDPATDRNKKCGGDQPASIQCLRDVRIMRTWRAERPSAHGRSSPAGIFVPAALSLPSGAT
jgi:hypothetical protein